MTFARWVFRLAGIYGLLVMPPLYFLEERIGVEAPPAITHPEYYYGFIGITIAWQVAFLVIGQDPARHRLMMLPAIIEKWSFVVAALVLLVQRRISVPMLAGACIDFVLGVCFAMAFWQAANGPPAAK